MPRGVIPWTATRSEWLQGRTAGIGGSDVAAILGYNKWQTPYRTWRQKTGRELPDEQPNPAAEFGVQAEPWIRESIAPGLIGARIEPTEWQTYQHDQHDHHMCTPDGVVPDTGALLEIKTAGIYSRAGGVPPGWEDDRGDPTVPLTYELQCRWNMHVMDAPACHLVALVAGVGWVHHEIRRDLATETTMVTAIDEWWDRYVIGDSEPPASSGDGDLLAQLHPNVEMESVELDPIAAMEAVALWRDATARLKAAERDRDAAVGEIRRLLGSAAVGMVDGEAVVFAPERKGGINYRLALKHVLAESGIDAPDMEQFRNKPSRPLKVKG